MISRVVEATMAGGGSGVAEGIKFVRPPQKQDYGTVAVFKDLYGNLWDLLQLNEDHRMSIRAV